MNVVCCSRDWRFKGLSAKQYSNNNTNNNKNETDKI